MLPQGSFTVLGSDLTQGSPPAHAGAATRLTFPLATEEPSFHCERGRRRGGLGSQETSAVMRNRHLPRLCRGCNAPMAGHDDSCWRCGVQWAIEEAPVTA